MLSYNTPLQFLFNFAGDAWVKVFRIIPEFSHKMLNFGGYFSFSGLFLFHLEYVDALKAYCKFLESSL